MKSQAEEFRLPCAFWEASLSHIDPQIAEKILLWVKKPENILFLRGIPGCGKTYLMAAILNDSWGKKSYEHKTVRYMYEKRMFNEIRMKAGPGSFEDPMGYAMDLCKAHYLMIDDFGSSKATDFVRDVWEMIMDERLNWGKRRFTIISSNLSNEEIYERFGGRTASRILCKANTQVLFDNVDRRLDSLIDRK